VRVTALGSGVNAALALIKLLAGLLGNSAALVADAVHSFSDLLTDVVVVVGIRIARRPRDESHDYGHGKAETLAAAAVGLMLFLVGAGLLYEGALSIYRGSEGILPAVPKPLALVAAALSIAAKEGLYRYTVREGRALGSEAVVANAWHHRSDALSSVGTVAGVGGAIVLGGRWVLLDPLAAAAVSAVILKVAWGIMRTSVDELLDCSIDPTIKERIAELVTGLDGVEDVHDLRTRRIGSTVAVECHISVRSDMDLLTAHALTEAAEEMIAACCGSDVLVTVHVDPVEPAEGCAPAQPAA
jgi:cation diffusion facilitator family transporter